jgi:hypothetical protein
MRPDHWNHANYSVSEGKAKDLEACLDAIFPWEKHFRREDIFGYRLVENAREGAIYFRVTGPASRVSAAIERLRGEDAALDGALRELEESHPDYNDHAGFLVGSVAEWERRVAGIEAAARDHPEWQLSVHTFRPEAESAMGGRVYQAFIRIGLLGPFRNTFEMQAIRER